MPITVVFDPPLPSDSPATFNTKAFTLLGDLNDWSTEANALPAELAVDLVAERSATATLTNKTLTNPSYSGATANGGTVTTIDINGGTIDGTVIGGSSAAAGSFTTLSASLASEFQSALTVRNTLTLTKGAAAINMSNTTGASARSDMQIQGTDATSTIKTYYVGVNAFSTDGSLDIKASNGVGINVGTTGAVSVAGDFSATSATFQTAVISSSSSNSVSQTIANNYAGSSTWVQYVSGGLPDANGNWGMYNGGVRLSISPAGVVTIPGTTSFTGGTFGYGVGAGGTVTQATSKSTAVTLNKPSGQITMNNAALAAGATVFFYLNNTTFANGDLLVINPLWGSADYQVWPGTVYGGTSLIAVKNISAGSLSDALVVRFAVIKGAAS